MSFLKVVLPVMALAAGTIAQSSCSTSGTLTVTNTADTASISGCSTYSGSIAVATGATNINIDGPKRITGNLVVIPNGALQTLEANNLQIVDGMFSVSQLQAIQSITMTALTQVNMFNMTSTGQNLLSLNFGSPGLTQVTNLSIVDTFLQSLTGINLTTAGSISITNNQLFQSLTMSLVNTTGDINIRGNNNGLIVNLNNLQSTNNLNINDCSGVQMNSLANTTGLASFVTNSFQSLSLPNLTNTQGFSVYADSKLNNLSVPLLASVASLNVYSNPALTGNVAFPALKNVVGAVNVTGAFTGVSMPMLNRVQGAFYVASSQNITSSCNVFNSDNNVFSTAPMCLSQVGNSSASTSASGTGSASPSSTSKSAATQYGPSEITYGIFGALAAIIGWLM